jgi:hypothetical protein
MMLGKRTAIIVCLVVTLDGKRQTFWNDLDFRKKTAKSELSTVGRSRRSKKF